MAVVDSKKLISKLSFTVSSAETDIQSRLRVGSMLNYLIQSAIESADALGFGFTQLRDMDLLWVLNKVEIQIASIATWYNSLVVETWPKNINGLSYIRDHIIKTDTGQLVAKASTAWLAIDLKSRKPKLIQHNNTEIFTRLHEKNAIERFPLKLKSVTSEEKFKRQARYFDIDLNEHVTATRYLDWMMDTFSVEFHEAHYPKNVLINYASETMQDEEIVIARKLRNIHHYCFEGLNNDVRLAFRGELKFN
jgi:medium-chain acyl-[acyl-carrier-protein] hydrolase